MKHIELTKEKFYEEVGKYISNKESIDFINKEINLKKEVLKENCNFSFSSEDGLITIENNSGIINVKKPDNFSIKYVN